MLIYFGSCLVFLVPHIPHNIPFENRYIYGDVCHHVLHFIFFPYRSIATLHKYNTSELCKFFPCILFRQQNILQLSQKHRKKTSKRSI